MKRLTLWIAAIALSLVAATSFAKDPLTKDERQARLQKAEAMFAERCKNAGEKIYRTVDDVEGIFLMKLRPSEINYGEQFKMDDPYGRDLGLMGTL